MGSEIRERFREIEHKLRSRLAVSIGLLIVLIAPPIFSLAPVMNEHLAVKSMQRHRERAERVARLIAEQSADDLVPQQAIRELFYSSQLSKHGAMLILKDGSVAWKYKRDLQVVPPPPLGGAYVLPVEHFMSEPGAILYERVIPTSKAEYKLVFLAESIPYSAADRLARLDVISLALAFGLGLVLVYWSYRGSLKLARSQHELALSLAHEIRTPLASMRLYSEMLSDGVAEREEQKQRFQELILAGTEKLSLVVDRLLAENSPAKPEDLERLTSPELLKIVREELEPFLTQAGITLETSVSDGCQAVCRCDPATLKQIFLIFADNAVKHGVGNENRTLRLEARTVRGLRRNSLIVSLRDFGSKKKVPHAQRKGKGLGLGLRIARRLAGCMGAVVRLKRNRPGRAAQLILPVAA